MVLSVGNIANDPNFDSAVSVEYVNAYHEARGNTAWDATNVEQNEQLLRKVGDYLIAVYGQAWSSQAKLMTAVPVALAKASAELALLAKSGPLITSQTRGKKRVKVGPIEVEYDGTAPTQKKFVMASLMLGPLLLNSGRGNMVRLVRC